MHKFSDQSQISGHDRLERVNHLRQTSHRESNAMSFQPPNNRATDNGIEAEIKAALEISLSKM